MKYVPGADLTADQLDAIRHHPRYKIITPDLVHHVAVLTDNFGLLPKVPKHTVAIPLNEIETGNARLKIANERQRAYDADRAAKKRASK